MVIFILQNGKTKVVELLVIAPGMQISSVSIEGGTLLHWAAKVSYFHIKRI